MSKQWCAGMVVAVVICGAVVESLGANARAAGVQAAPTGSVAGRVIDETTERGVPLANVTVRVAGLGVVAATTTDVAGRFVVTDVPAREVSVGVERLGYLMPAADAAARVTVRPNRTVLGVLLTLRREVLGSCGEAGDALSVDLPVPFPDAAVPKFLPLELME